MIIIDSSYLFALRDTDDSLHMQAHEFLKKLVGNGIFYLEDVLKEVQTVITVRKKSMIGFDWIDSIYKNESDLDRQYTLSAGEYFEVLNFWRKLGESRLSFVDAEIIYLANKYNFQVLTFDQEIIKRLPTELVFTK